MLDNPRKKFRVNFGRTYNTVLHVIANLIHTVSCSQKKLTDNTQHILRQRRIVMPQKYFRWTSNVYARIFVCLFELQKSKVLKATCAVCLNVEKLHIFTFKLAIFKNLLIVRIAFWNTWRYNICEWVLLQNKIKDLLFEHNIN